jgi:hypothetical protein
MNTFRSRWICRLLIVAMLAFPYSLLANAALIGTEQALAASHAQGDRERLRDLGARADVQRQLGALPAGSDIGIIGALLIVLLVVVIVQMMQER